MVIRHETVNFNGIDKIYIYVEISDKYELAQEFLNPDSNNSFLNKLKDYVTKKISFKKEDMAVLIINGVLIGAVSLGILSNEIDDKTKSNTQSSGYSTYKMAVDYKLDNSDNEKELEKEIDVVEDKLSNNEASENLINSSDNANISSVVKSEVMSSDSIVSNPAVIPQSVEETSTANDITIQLSTNGIIKSIDLENYVIGVVAAEMPALFNIEALKAQAIAVRTYVMRKKVLGQTIINSNSNQVYKSESDLKQLWGDLYDKYYNRIKDAVDSTKGLVLIYNGEYIDALYFSISNSKTESPKYVWSRNEPYLQSVNSDWDTSVEGYEVSKNISYNVLSNTFGKTINKDTEFIILSKTVSGRVDSIMIDNTTYSGTKIRSLLGLRSTDFSIVQDDLGVIITTRGFGHGVGMSQNGANEAAKDGYTYEQILHHYYTGVQITKI